jgi:hypothetical protein
MANEVPDFGKKKDEEVRRFFMHRGIVDIKRRKERRVCCIQMNDDPVSWTDAR